MTESTKTLVAKRGLIKAQLTRFRTYLSAFQDQPNQTKEYLQTRLEKAEKLWDKFEDVQSEIEELDEAAEQNVERLAFESSYFDTISLAKTILSQITRDTSSVTVTNEMTSSRQTTDTKAQVRLPKIDMPTFSGAYDEWMQFYDMFNTLIHTNTDLTPTQRFQYLRSSLKDDAAQVISSLEISAGNYDVAWNLLKERFDNKRIIVNNHVKALFELPIVTKESYVSTRQLLSNVQKHLRSLNALNLPTEQWDVLIIHLICTKLDVASRKEWENKASGTELPTMEQMIQFLTKRAQVLESLYTNTNRTTQLKITNPQLKSRTTEQSVSCVTTTACCSYCQKSQHALYKCYKFIGLPVKARIEEAIRMRVCFNCLRTGHRATECHSSTCQTCQRRHNTLLHQDEVKPQDKSAVASAEKRPTQGKPGTDGHSVTLTCNVNHNQIVLPTALVKVFDTNNTCYIVRALLDTGSQSNFITNKLCDKLQPNLSKSNVTISGLNQVVSKTSARCDIVIRSLNESFSTNITCLVISQITNNMPLPAIQSARVQVPPNLELADPSFNETKDIDMLLGAATFFDVLCKERITYGRNQPVLQNTLLGWIVAGTVTSSQPHYTDSANLLCITEDQLQKGMERFWELEETSTAGNYSKDERDCETHFTQTFKRAEDGRFILEMPLRKTVNQLGETRDIALKRIESVERRFKKNPHLKERYVQFMREYEELGHMTRCNESSQEALYYLPHHPVLKEDSLTTKLRVVFDASAQPANGLSLNQVQLVGPTIQNDLYSIVVRFRTHEIVLTADVEKMYRQVWIAESQRRLQCILWRSESDAPVTNYKLNTITYGTAAAPFMAVRCLVQLALENKERYPVASDTIKSDFYVDDLLTGAKNVDEAIQLYTELSTILQQAQFKLRKWTSNNAEVLNKISHATTADTNIVYVCENSATKTLGIHWNPMQDVLQYTVNISEKQRQITKRVVLSIISQIYDPLGLLSPIIIIAKIFMQKLWQSHLGWDEPLTGILYTEWCKFRQGMQQVTQITIPRHIKCSLPICIEMHGFCDASEKAYAACIYIRSTDERQNTSVHLVCSKTKVAPLKTISVPRLELCGALLLTRLVIKTRQSLRLSLQRTVLWTDSTVVLCWIRTTPNLLKTFVSNRVTEIQTGTEGDIWKHVPSNDNPADIASRGTNARSLQDSNIWWHGPGWLEQQEAFWPSIVCPETAILPEMKSLTQSCHVAQEQFTEFTRYSNLNKLIRIISYVLRFKENCLPSENLRQTGPITIKEFEAAERCLIKCSQMNSFSEEIKALANLKNITRKSKLASLDPFLDNQGLLRVGGRLKHSTFEFDKKHPIILDTRQHLTQLIFRAKHIRLLHAGPQLLLSHIREQFWPIGGRNLARKIVRQCVTCFRNHPKHLHAIMGNLPADRVTVSYPFHATGVDYAGPFMLKDRKGRNFKLIKCYICLFVCFVTKAVHLELVSELTTEAFIMTLRRFIARRGNPAHIYSDNGTNFVGANNKLKELNDFLQTYESKLQELCTQERITWHFIPANSPHLGGLWEAGVKSTKYHLRRVLGNVKLTFEEFYTTIVQIESILNSRPLSPLSQDPNDPTPLTPSHFLVGRSLTTVADPNLQSLPENRLSLYQRMQQLCQHFWSRWSKEYVSELQQRQRWKNSQQNVAVGTIVVIKDDNLPPLCWLLGKIEEVHPGDDGVIRVVSVKTSKGIIKRAISKICPLPAEDSVVQVQ